MGRADRAAGTRRRAAGPVATVEAGPTAGVEADPHPGAEAHADTEAGADSPRARRTRNRRPYAVVAGLVVSFSFFALLGVTLISALGLPDDILRYVGLTLLVLIGVGLVFPRVESLLERPFARIPQRQVGREGGAFALGVGLGLLYVPCAGPVLAAITVAGAHGRISVDIVALTVSFAVGTAVPLLAFALAGRRVAERDAARQQLSGLYGKEYKELSRCEDGVDELRSCGRAPGLKGITKWLNTPQGRPVELAALRGKVVLIDFWTYSCVNCQRSLPHVKAWDRAYRDAGLRVIGVHSPEFAFEKNASNVADQTRKMGVDYPVALDNKLATWDNYRNRYWPAKYLIDSSGTVRYFRFGEGKYEQTEGLIRDLLRQADPGVRLPAATTGRADALTEDRTPETYLSTHRIDRYIGDPLATDEPRRYRLPADLPRDAVALGGTWTAGYEHFTAGREARIAPDYRARKVHLVLAGQGPVEVLVDGKPTRTIQVDGTPTLHTLVDEDDAHRARLEVRPAPGIEAYAFTFG